MQLNTDYSKRIDDLRSAMSSNAIDLVAIGPGAHMAWLLGVRPHADERHLLLCATSSYVGFLMPALEAESARNQTDLPFHTWTDEQGPQAAFLELLEAAGASYAKSIALDESMRADFAALVQDTLPNANRQFAESTIGSLRMKKDDSEFKMIKHNAQIADEAMQEAWSAMQPGMSEAAVADVIRDNFKHKNVKPVFAIIGAGANGAYPHHHTGDTLLKQGDAVVMDIGGAIGGYSSDITRMAIIGREPTGYSDIHAIVESAVMAALSAAKPGVRAHVVDDAARNAISDAGYGEYFVHRTGHGMGIEPHEPPYITASSQTVLEAGMVFSIEPGIYLPGRFGVRLEEIVILRDNGPEIVSDLSRDVRVIGD